MIFKLIWYDWGDIPTDVIWLGWYSNWCDMTGVIFQLMWYDWGDIPTDVIWLGWYNWYSNWCDMTGVIFGPPPIRIIRRTHMVIHRVFGWLQISVGECFVCRARSGKKEVPVWYQICILWCGDIEGKAQAEGAKRPSIEGVAWASRAKPEKKRGRGLGRGLGEPFPKIFLKIQTWNGAIWCIVVPDISTIVHSEFHGFPIDYSSQPV